MECRYSEFALGEKCIRWGVDGIRLADVHSLELAEGHLNGFILLYVMKSFHGKQYWIGRAPFMSYSSTFCPSSFPQPLKAELVFKSVLQVWVQLIFYDSTLYHSLDTWFSIPPARWPLTSYLAHFPLGYVRPNLVVEEGT